MVIMLVISFKKLKIIIVVIMIYTIRNIVPLYDPERRKLVMGEENWNILVVF